MVGRICGTGEAFSVKWMSDGVMDGESDDDRVYPDNTRVAIITAQKLGKQQLLQVFCIV